jgi:hypothetical protein
MMGISGSSANRAPRLPWIAIPVLPNLRTRRTANRRRGYCMAALGAIRKTQDWSPPRKVEPNEYPSSV